MKIAIVTGASSGMGREFVKQISRLYTGLDEIWVIARRRERLTPVSYTHLDVYKRQLWLPSDIHREIRRGWQSFRFQRHERSDRGSVSVPE